MKTINPRKISLAILLFMVMNTNLLRAAKRTDVEIVSHFISCPTNDLATACTFIYGSKFDLAAMPEGSKLLNSPTLMLDLATLPTGWKLLSSPTVVTSLGQPAEIRITENPSQYFVKQSDGCFQLRQMRPEDGAGATLTINTAAGSREESVKLDAKVQFSSILKREELPDVALEVGKPVIVKNTRQFTMETSFGWWILSDLSDSPFPGSHNTNSTVLLLMRIRRVDSTGVPIDARGNPLPR